MENKAKPFIKWVGGKRQLLPKILEIIPKEINSYFEPFIGGGALYFNIDAKKYYISDINEELINLYSTIKNNKELLINELKLIETEYFSYKKGDKESDLKSMEKVYYKYRNVDRTEDYHSWSDPKKAARFIFLNKTGFNGLYRVNKKGQNNTPFGKYYSPNILDQENLSLCSLKLNLNTTITHSSFEDILNKVKKGDFVYFDPPYVPLNKTSNFTSYSKENFNLEMQLKLKKLCDNLTKKGVKFLLSNSSADFVLDLYKEYQITMIDASRSINSDGAKRGAVKEVLVKNY